MIPLFKAISAPGIGKRVQACFDSGYTGQGKRVEEFERELGKLWTTAHVLALNSCTSAIHLALRLANAGPGTEVIVTPMTCKATIDPIVERGAKIVWADIDPWTGNIDMADVRKKVSRETRAVIGVSWAGYPVDLSWDGPRDFRTIADHAHGVGIAPNADFNCYSFQSIKNMQTGDGGALVCRWNDDHKRGKLLRWYGMDRDSPKVEMRCEDDVAEHGYKFGMNDVTAVIGLEQLAQLPETLARQRKIADQLDAAIMLMLARPGLRAVHSCDSFVPWVYGLHAPNSEARDEAIELFKAEGVHASRVHVRCDTHSCFAASRSDLPGVTEFDSTQFSIPCGWWMSDDDVQTVIRAVRKVNSAISLKETVHV